MWKLWTIIIYLENVINTLTRMYQGCLSWVIGLSKNIGQHGWPTTKKFKITLAKTP